MKNSIPVKIHMIYFSIFSSLLSVLNLDSVIQRSVFPPIFLLLLLCFICSLGFDRYTFYDFNLIIEKKKN